VRRITTGVKPGWICYGVNQRDGSAGKDCYGGMSNSEVSRGAPEDKLGLMSWKESNRDEKELDSCRLFEANVYFKSRRSNEGSEDHDSV
jgi:hypothetical protein